MSGGSYDNLYSKEAEQLFENLELLQFMTEKLKSLNYAEYPAHQTERLINLIKSTHQEIENIRTELSPVWRAIEYWESGDSGEEAVKEAIENIGGPDGRHRDLKTKDPQLHHSGAEAPSG